MQYTVDLSRHMSDRFRQFILMQFCSDSLAADERDAAILKGIGQQPKGPG